MNINGLSERENLPLPKQKVACALGCRRWISLTKNDFKYHAYSGVLVCSRSCNIQRGQNREPEPVSPSGNFRFHYQYARKCSLVYICLISVLLGTDWINMCWFDIIYSILKRKQLLIKITFEYNSLSSIGCPAFALIMLFRHLLCKVQQIAAVGFRQYYSKTDKFLYSAASMSHRDRHRDKDRRRYFDWNDLPVCFWPSQVMKLDRFSLAMPESDLWVGVWFICTFRIRTLQYRCIKSLVACKLYQNSVIYATAWMCVWNVKCSCIDISSLSVSYHTSLAIASRNPTLVRRAGMRR